jgi:hypothetical protein
MREYASGFASSRSKIFAPLAEQVLTLPFEPWLAKQLP